MNDPSISHWIKELKAGESDAAQCLWELYFSRLFALARRQLGTVVYGGRDAEDVAQSVFKSLCLGAEIGKFPQVTDRNNLWTLLVAMTAYKSRDLIRHERCLKRGGGRVLDEVGLALGEECLDTLAEIASSDPTPEFAADVAEQCEELLARLTETERQTAELKLQRFTNREIAGQMSCGLRTVERRLDRIRRAWIA